MNNQSQKKRPEPDSYTKKTGGWMIFIAWIAFLAFLAYSFNHLIKNQSNPNQSVTTAYIEGSKQVTLTRNKYGHYVATGKINGQPVVFLLDTGATDVAISARLAKKLGLKQGRSFRVRTANGITTAYRTTLDSVTLGEIQLNDVPASILSNAADDQVLLGMSFLKHMGLIQQGNQLTIRQ